MTNGYLTNDQNIHKSKIGNQWKSKLVKTS